MEPLLEGASCAEETTLGRFLWFFLPSFLGSFAPTFLLHPERTPRHPAAPAHLALVRSRAGITTRCILSLSMDGSGARMRVHGLAGRNGMFRGPALRPPPNRSHGPPHQPSQALRTPLRPPPAPHRRSRDELPIERVSHFLCVASLRPDEPLVFYSQKSSTCPTQVRQLPKSGNFNFAMRTRRSLSCACPGCYQ